MSNEATATAPKTSKPKAAKAKPQKKAGSPQRAALLKELRKKDGTLASLIKRTGLPERAVYHHLWHLRKDGFVKTTEVDVDGKKDQVFGLSASGKKLAASA